MIKKVYHRGRTIAYRMKKRVFKSTPTAAVGVPFVKPAIRAEALARHGGKFRVAVIGAGNQGRDLSLGIRQLEGAELVAVADRSEEALAKLKARLEMPDLAAFTDARELLDKTQVDLVCVATNTPSHVPLGNMALEAGAKYLLLEKPIGSHPAKARELVRACEERGVTLAVNHSRRWSLDYIAIKRYLAGGQLGEARHIYVGLGSGGMAMNGVHFIDLMRFFIPSDIAWVVGNLDEVTTPNKRGAEFYDPGGYALLAFANGARAFIDTSQDMLRKDSRIVIRAEHGMIEVSERERQWRVNGENLNFSVPFADAKSIPGMSARVIAGLLSGGKPASDGADGVAALETVIALHLSHNCDHQPVRLPLDSDGQMMEIPFP